MKIIITILFFTLSAIPMVSFAQPATEIDKNLENISGQYAECAAYYEFTYYALKSSGEVAGAQAYMNLEEQAMFYSWILASEGRDKDMALNVTNSRINMYKKQMRKETNNAAANISILINKYHFSCDEIIKTPNKKVMDILSRIEYEMSLRAK